MDTDICGAATSNMRSREDGGRLLCALLARSTTWTTVEDACWVSFTPPRDHGQISVLTYADTSKYLPNITATSSSGISKTDTLRIDNVL